MEEIQLKVEKAYPIDLGRGIIRLDPTALLKLQLSPGDLVEIMGKKKTTAKVWRADRQDWEQGIVRIDNFVRQNAGVSIGEKVTIKKVKAPLAKKVILALPESVTPEVVEFRSIKQANDIIKRYILKRPVFKGDIIPLIYSMSELETEFKTKSLSEYLTKDQNSGRLIPLVVVDTEPSDSIVQVFEETKIELSDKIFQNSEVSTSFTSSNIKGSSLTPSNNICITAESASEYIVTILNNATFCV
jgi:transitional endoplasmic reticulum ATPase